MVGLPQRAQDVIDTLKKAGYEAWAVGGSVRDTIMDRPTKGWDFTTSAHPEKILELFPDSFYDNQFGTVGIKIRETSGKEQETGEEREVIDIYEITTYRSEDGYTDKRHPDIISWGKTIEEDLSRRDFTINAIAVGGSDVIDPYGGQEDLGKKLIKTVGNPSDRFAEDALRMMRAIRQAAELGFMIEPTTLDAIKKHADLIKNISWERIRDELIRILGSDHAADGIMLLKNTGLLTYILPELEAAFTVTQKSPKRHHIYDVGTHSVMALKFCTSGDPIVRLATLLHDIGKPKTFHKTDEGVITFYNHEVVGARIAKEIGNRLRLSKKQIDLIVTLVRWHQFTVDERQTDSALRRFIRHAGIENLDAMLALRTGDRLGGGARETSWRLELFKKRLEEVQKQPFSVADLKVNGHDVMEIYQVKPSKIIGDVLEKLFAEVEAGTLPNERDALLARMKTMQQDENRSSNERR